MHRTAYAYVKSDQPLCYSLIGNYHIKTCCKGNFIILASLCCLVGWFECHFVVNPEDRFSRVTSHIGFGKLYGYKSIKQSYLEACKFSHDYEETKTLQIWTSTWDFGIYSHTVKPVLSGHSKRSPKNDFQDQLLLNAGHKYCRMLQESILQYFRPSLSYHLSIRSLFSLFLSGRLRQVLL